jgi:coiled-coil domain-containing protein 130
MQGFNMGRYVPPELEGTISANKVAGKHALGKRASKIKEGILTVRFEMPFATWCTTCPKPTIIGQGVRFNAEKKKVGNYFSTPIWSFRMKHVACGGWIEIHTDPKNTAYVVKEGGKARDNGEDRVREGEEGVPILTAEERERRRQDAFAVLEDKKQDQVQEKEHGKRIVQLQEARDQHWHDPYEENKRLRRTFRTERKVREKEHNYSEKLKDQMGLDVELMPETDQDRQHAAMIDYGGIADEDDQSDNNHSTLKVVSRPLFQATRTKPKAGHKTKAAAEGERRKRAFQQELRENSRAAVDPFLAFGSSQDSRNFSAMASIKKKKSSNGQEEQVKVVPKEVEEVEDKSQRPALCLVAYDSD